MSQDPENDYGHSRIHTQQLIDGIKRQIKTDEVIESGGSVREVADVIMDGTDWKLLGLQMNVVLGITAIAELLGENVLELPVMDGYKYAVQGFVDHPLAIEFDKFIQESGEKSVEDLFGFIFSKGESSNTFRTVLASKDDIEYQWFVDNVLPLKIRERHLIARNRQEQDVKRLKHEEAIAQTHAAAEILDMPHKDYIASRSSGSNS